MIHGGPIIIPDERRVTLRAIQQEDSLPPAGLLFSRVEFDNLVSTMYPSPKYSFDKSFFDELFDLTDGHVGAITDFMRIIPAHEVGPILPDPCHDLIPVISCNQEHLWPNLQMDYIYARSQPDYLS